ncbi:Zn-dependent hydrolase [Agrobacterium vitis]|uniref:Zn-dependent hydrolase n=1 Tax=Agrobacterium vitis TaxID=373 RepID=UPI0012E7150A|nr:Zn-dependent hydrolase [Agrobacterium vitis]MVA22071.1 Zn-dependent hydrolase [Agrobacterium vitis]
MNADPTIGPASNAVVTMDRLWQDLMALAEITEPGRPYTRRSFSDRFLDGRAWIEARLRDAGMSIRYDTAANLIGRLEGTESGLPTIAIGSHSDTVPSGGRFDGILGVVAGIEVIRTLRERRIALRHTIEIIDFLAEEPSEYGLSCVGSRAMSGHLPSTMLALQNPEGETLRQAIARIGGRPEELSLARRSDIAAFLELHIEQGRVLESSTTDLGIVTSIVGIVRLEIEFTGSADHAGATPFDLRRDALVAAAVTVTAVRTIGERFAVAGRGYFIATTGVIEAEPNAANVVPRLARLVVEARAEDAALLEAFVVEIDRASVTAAVDASVERSVFRQLSDSLPAHCDLRLRDHMATAALALGLSAVSMASGAGHDASFIAQIAPIAMAFVPSKEGRSHCPEEWTDPQQCADGAALLLETLLRVDADEAFDHQHSAPGIARGPHDEQ